MQLPAVAMYALLASGALLFVALRHHGKLLSLLLSFDILFGLVAYETGLAMLIANLQSVRLPDGRVLGTVSKIHVTNILDHIPALYFLTNFLVFQVCAVAIAALSLAAAYRAGLLARLRGGAPRD